MKLVASPLILLLQMSSLTVASLVQNKAQQAVIDQMLANYDRRIRPYPENSSGAVTVDVDMFISSLTNINEINMEYSMDIYLRQRWTDLRLSFPSSYEFVNQTITMTPQQVHQLWLPDLFISNSLHGKQHTITTPNYVVWLSKGGNVVYSQRVSLTMQCHMDFHYFPGDNQTCSFFAESYGYSTDNLVFRWHEYAQSDKKAIEYMSAITLPEFDMDLNKAVLEDCTKTFSTGEFSCIGVHFFLKRSLGFYMTQLFVPSILIVLLSWLSFFIDVKAAPARVSIGLLTVLSITTQSSGIRSQLPKVAYTKAIDVWMATCLVFVALAFFEYAIAANRMRKAEVLKEKQMEQEEKAKQKREKLKATEVKNHLSSGNGIQNPSYDGGMGDLESQPHGNSDNNCNKGSPVHSWGEPAEANSTHVHQPCCKCSCHIVDFILNDVDYYSRFVFPILFSIFNVVFWVVYF